MSDKPVENVDIVAAILTSSIVQNIPLKPTPARGFITDSVQNDAVEIFKRIKKKLLES